MRISPEHLARIESDFVANREKIVAHKVFLLSPENPRQPKDLEMRLRWDSLTLLFGAKWICDELYPYLNDTHIDSALRAAMNKLTR